MKCICKTIKEFFHREWSLSEKVMVILICFLGGIIHGFLWSPIKKGISCGNNNGNSTTYLNGENPEEN